jgi:hypothetical protein
LGDEIAYDRSDFRFVLQRALGQVRTEPLLRAGASINEDTKDKEKNTKELFKLLPARHILQRSAEGYLAAPLGS